LTGLFYFYLLLPFLKTQQWKFLDGIYAKPIYVPARRSFIEGGFGTALQILLLNSNKERKDNCK
jgi:hypothetical protein